MRGSSGGGARDDAGNRAERGRLVVRWGEGEWEFTGAGSGWGRLVEGGSGGRRGLSGVAEEEMEHRGDDGATIQRGH